MNLILRNYAISVVMNVSEGFLRRESHKPKHKNKETVNELFAKSGASENTLIQNAQ